MSVQPVSYRLSVLLVTFNHQQYINQALNSLFNQKFEYDIELVVADDCSSDKTMDIIREYEGKDARFHFKYLNNSLNLGVTKNYQRSFAECSGEYIAVLEGDDYWVSPVKIQRQYDFLNAHWECDLCSVNYFVYEEDRFHFYARTVMGFGHRFISARDLIADNLVGNFSTCMYRKTALDKLPPKLYEIKSYDWIVNICVASCSLIGFLEEPMSVYRLHSDGVWSQTSHIEKLKTQLENIPSYNALTNNIFHDDFNALASRLRHGIAMSYIGDIAYSGTKPVRRGMPFWLDLIPPVMMTVARAIMPPALKRFIIRNLQKNRVI